jgi:FlaA1/EpsC-like NDP-sugar epimerase
MQARYPGTHFVAVRFGNVLGSNGSVVPLFQKQIAAGGPITVTHSEVTRFFMTIPEAVQLVLQAGLLPAARGRITMLDMGEPVKILDLARNLVRLSGLRPDVDIEFRYTGLRPGEKLHETLSGEDEVLSETELHKVWIVAPRAPSAADVLETVLGVLEDDALPPAERLGRLEALVVGSPERADGEPRPLRHRRREHAPA